MGPKEALKGLGYLVGADVFIKTLEEDNRLFEKAYGKPIKTKALILAKSTAKLGFGTYKQMAVIPYRFSGLDLITRGVRKLVSRRHFSQK